MSDPIKIGVSSCLLGHMVRYNGGHSHDSYITQNLGAFVVYLPVCPEVECGMPKPREAIRLAGYPDNPRLMTQKTCEDKTSQMTAWIDTRINELAQEDLCGFIFKNKSPSCGLYGIGVYGDDGKVRKNGTGLFAKAFTEAFPRIPVQEAGRLRNLRLRENFVESIFTLKRWRVLIEQDQSLGSLVRFHTHNKLLILSHSQEIYRKMGQIVALGKKHPKDEIFDLYEAYLLKTINLKTTPAKNINVLHHMMGYFKKNLTGDEKSELIDILGQYRAGNIPLIVPITLFKHYVRKYDKPWLKTQTYLNPHPLELKLRNYY